MARSRVTTPSYGRWQAHYRCSLPSVPRKPLFFLYFPRRGIRNMAGSSNHLIGLEEEHGRNREAESLSGLEVDHELELGGLLHGQVPRLGPLQNLVHIGGGG